MLPVELEAQIDIGLQVGLQGDARIEGQPVLRQPGVEVNLHQIGPQLDVALETEVQAVLVEPEAQSGADTGLRCPVGIEVGLQPHQRGRARGAIHRRRQASQAGHPGRVQVGVDVLLDIVTHAHQRREVEDVVQRLVQQRQLVAALQIGAHLAELASHAQQGTRQATAQRHVQVGQAEAGVHRLVEVDRHRLAAHHHGLVHHPTRTVQVQGQVARQRHTGQAGHGHRCIARQRQRIAGARHHHGQAAVADGGVLAFHIHLGLQASGADDGAAIGHPHREAAGALHPGRGRRVLRILQLDGDGACGLQQSALEVQPLHRGAAQLDRRGAIECAVAVQVTAAEIDHTAGQRARPRAGVDRQAQRAAFQRQARHAGQAGAGCVGAQADEGARATGVFQHHHADAGLVQFDPDEAVGADAGAQLHVDMARRQHRRRHLAPGAVVQRGAAAAQAGQSEGALQQHGAAHLDLRVGHERQEIAAGAGKVQRNRLVHTGGDLAGAHLQAVVHRRRALAGDAQFQHIARRLGANTAKRLVGLQAQRGGVHHQVHRIQAELGGVQRQVVDVGLQRQPAAAVALHRVERTQQGHGQAQAADLDATDPGRDVAGADHQAGHALAVAGHGGVQLTLGHQHRATGLERVTDLDHHGAAGFEQFTVEVQRGGRCRTHGNRIGPAAAPVQRAASGAAQPQVGGKTRVGARQGHTIGGGAQHLERIGHALHRQPAAVGVARSGPGQHQTEVQPLHGKADRRRVRTRGHAGAHIGAGHHQHAAVHAAAARQGQRLAVRLEASRAAERQHAAHRHVHRAVGAHGLAECAVQRHHHRGAAAGADRHRLGLEVDHMAVGRQAGRQPIDEIELQVQGVGRQRDVGQTDQVDGACMGGQGHPARACQRVPGLVLRAGLGAEHTQGQVHLAQGQAHRIGVGRVQAVDLVVVVAVDTVGAVGAEEGIDLVEADGQFIDRHRAAVGQLHRGAARLERGRAVHIDRIAHGQREAGRRTQGLAIGTGQRHGLGLASARGDIERRAGEVKHAAARRIGQVDRHAGVAHFGGDIGHTQQARRAGRGLQCHAAGQGAASGEQGRGVDAAAGGHCGELRAGAVEGHRAPGLAGRRIEQAPAGAGVVGHPDATVAAIGRCSDGAAVGRNGHGRPAARIGHRTPFPGAAGVGGLGVGHVQALTRGGRDQVAAGGVGGHRHPVGHGRRIAGLIGPDRRVRAWVRTEEQPADGAWRRRRTGGRQHAGAGGADGQCGPVGIAHRRRQAQFGPGRACSLARQLQRPAQGVGVGRAHELGAALAGHADIGVERSADLVADQHQHIAITRHRDQRVQRRRGSQLQLQFVDGAAQLTHARVVEAEQVVPVLPGVLFLVGVDLGLDPAGLREHGAQLARHIGLHLRVGGLATGAVAFGGEIGGQHGVLDRLGADAVDSDHVARGKAARQGQHVHFTREGFRGLGAHHAPKPPDLHLQPRPASGRIGGARRQRQAGTAATGKDHAARRFIQGLAQLGGHIGQHLGGRAAGAATQAVGAQVGFDDAVDHIAHGQAAHGDGAAFGEAAVQPQHVEARRGTQVGAEHAAIGQQHHVGVAVGSRVGAQPSATAVGRAHDAAAIHRRHDGLAVGRDRDRDIAQPRGRAAGAPALAAVDRQPQAGAGAASAAGNGHLAAVGHRHIAPVQRLRQHLAHHLALGGDHQREVDIGQRQAHRLRSGRVLAVDLAVAVGIDQRPAVQAGKGLQVGTAHRQHVVADDAAIVERHQPGRLLEAQ